MTPRLPFFVYGTLRPGGGNDRLWRLRATPVLDGHALALGMMLRGNGIPYATPAHGQVTVGCLVYPAPDEYDAVLASLDQLEGVPNHYVRATIGVQLHDPALIVPAWTYFAADSSWCDRMRPVPGNDWMAGRFARTEDHWTAWLDEAEADDDDDDDDDDFASIIETQELTP